MYRNSFLKQILLSLFVVLFFASCDKDFNEIGTNIIGDDHFGFDKYTEASIKAYNQKLGPIASNNLAINALGIYYNPAFGKTTASFVTQLEMDVAPVFNNTDPTKYVNLPVIDSVVLNVPYFSTLKTTVDGVKTYELDSIFGEDLGKIKLGIYESGFYLRDLDPSEQLGTQQVFYTDKNGEIDSHKIGQKLNNADDVAENDQFFFSAAEIKEETLDTNEEVVITRTAPAMRMHLDTAFFTAKILNAPSGQLFNNNIFKNYMRGLYFKVENAGANPGNMAMLNFKNGKTTVYYKEDKITEDDPTTPAINEYKLDRLNKTFVLKLTGNTVSLLDNSNEDADYINGINNPNTTIGDERLYLKGGEGSMAVIDLFGTADVLSYDAEADVMNNVPNGIPDELDVIKKNKWLINEANLTFYVDKDKMANAQTIEPERILLFDLTNKRTLIDYAFDNTTNPANPKRSKTTFGGIIEKEDVVGGRGVQYKVRITNYVRNLIRNDSTNVRLGLSLTENINNVDMSKLKTANAATDKAPKMTVLSPLGTVVYGTNSSLQFPTPVDKRLKLEIYYTKPD